VTDKPTPPYGASSSSASQAATPPRSTTSSDPSPPGTSKRDAIRCLNRHLARELYNDIQTIVTTTQPQSEIAA
jgi:hypothetical protein